MYVEISLGLKLLSEVEILHYQCKLDSKAIFLEALRAVQKLRPVTTVTGLMLLQSLKAKRHGPTIDPYTIITQKITLKVIKVEPNTIHILWTI